LERSTARSEPRVLAVTRIFPNRVEPLACAFQRQLLGALAHLCPVEVLAVIPYLLGSSLLGERTRPGRLARVPARDEIDGIPVIHPRVPYVPGVAAVPLLAPFNAPLYLAGLLPHVPRLRGRFDVVLGTFLYPDACAAALLARLLGVPYVIKTHGTDVNVVARWGTVRPMIESTVRGASFSIGVSAPIVKALVELGAPPERAVLLQNGVDRTVFHPMDRAAARAALGLPARGRIVTYVGRLEKEKGLRELVQAFERLGRASTEPVHLALVGRGSLGEELDRAAAELVLSSGGRILLAGERPLDEVARYLAASDVLALPSWAEGTPNVVLEALAAGRPVVASRVGGIPDVIEDGRTGLLVPPRDVGALAAALGRALRRTWREADLVAAAPPSWEESAGHLLGLLLHAVHPSRLEAA
jgi:teichuronic acid biosynthesis glycosyltransferase TuaC